MVASCNQFMETVESKIGNSRLPNYDSKEPCSIYFTTFGEDYDVDDNALPYGEEIQDIKMNEIDDAYIDSLDKYIRAEVVVPGKDSPSVLAKIRNRKRDTSGIPIGEANQNPILDTRIYEVEFPDGRVEEYSTYTIRKSIATDR